MKRNLKYYRNSEEIETKKNSRNTHEILPYVTRIHENQHVSNEKKRKLNKIFSEMRNERFHDM